MKIWVPFFVGIWGLIEQVAPFTPGYVQSMVSGGEEADEEVVERGLRRRRRRGGGEEEREG